MPADSTRNLATTHLRLRPDSVEELPVDAAFWPRLMRGELGDFHHEYLVTTSLHSEDWPNWEMHPNGDEIVCLLAGRATFILETLRGNEEVLLAGTGDYVFVPRGTWHTARTSTPTTLLFITPGEGTQHRPA